jgi:hypothetical protein
MNGMSDDGCKRVEDDAARRLKLASGIIVYLMEELGDARLRCAQLKKHVHDATELIEKSDHRDHFFEVAGNLIYGIPDTLLKLDKALDATALAAARLDYEEIKNGLRPEKADELETALEETRLRYLNRRSGKDSTMDKTAKLMARQEAILKKYLDTAGGRAAMDFESLPEPVQAALRRVKDQETLDSDVNRWLMDNNNPHLRSTWAGAGGSAAPPSRSSTMNAKSAAYFLNKIADLTDKQGRVPVAAVMTLVAKLEKGDKKAAVMNSKASTAFRNIAKHIASSKNPSRVALAGLLRRIVGDTLQVGIQQQGGQQQQQPMAGAGEDFQKANPKITDEEAKVIDEMHDEHKDVVKDKAEQAQQQQ